MDDLIARLESAAAGSRELDCRVIAHLIGGEAAISQFNGLWCVYRGTDRRGDPRPWEPSGGWEINLYRASADNGPTRSLDAAITLMPEGVWFLLGVGRTQPDEPLYGARIMRAGGTIEGPALGEGEHMTSLPIALVIAALRTRQAEGGR